MDRVIKTVIADDEQIARQVLREELELLPEVTIVGEAENGREALQQIVELQPDLVFLDLQMPGMGGFEVVRNLSGPRLPVIRSEEHTSELQSLRHLVCRLLIAKKQQHTAGGGGAPAGDDPDREATRVNTR